MSLSQQKSPYVHWEYVHPESGDRLRIVPERGGLVTAWCSNGRELLYLDQERFADPGKSIRGGIPVLFPICGNLPGDLLPLPCGEFTLKQHGFARDMPWELQLLEDHSGVKLSLSDTDATRAAYPFEFLIEMLVRPIRNALEIDTTVHNLSQTAMPFSFGLHPYLNVTDLSQVRLEGLPNSCLNHLEMAEAETAIQLAHLTEGVDFLTRPAGPVSLVDEASGRCLKLQHDKPMDLTVVWSDPPRQMVCLEPWTSPRQALITGDRKLEIEAGSQQKLRCSLANC
ncbi:MAG: galactose mutarotase [Prochlorococcus sp.]